MDTAVLDQAFRRLGAADSAAENHGILCGLLCAQGHVAQPDWLTLMRQLAAPDDGYAEHAGLDASAADQAAVSALYEETLSRLREADSLFEPLLPDDDEPLPIRSAAMAQWCGGFLYGLGAGGVRDFSVLPEDVREIAGDIAEISRAGTDGGESEEDEAAYAEIVEYLRAGVTLVFEILESERSGPQVDRTIH